MRVEKRSLKSCNDCQPWPEIHFNMKKRVRRVVNSRLDLVCLRWWAELVGKKMMGVVLQTFFFTTATTTTTTTTIGAKLVTKKKPET